MKRKLFLSLIIVSALAALGFALSRGHVKPVSSKLKVVASFYPMGEFARQVGGDRVDVSVLIQPGVEPHDYDPTPRDVAQVHDARVLVYNGAGLETWADKLSPELERDGLTVVKASSGQDLINGDPHVWLDPVRAEQEVKAIAAGLSKADPDGRSKYEYNAAAYVAKLQALDTAYRTGLASCDRRDILTAHEAFGYLSQRYDITAVGIAGLSPEEEPTPAKLAELTTLAKRQGVKYVFFETLTSPKLADTLASEVGAKTLVFNPLEGLTDDEVASGDNYLTVQRQNLTNLRLALDCK